MGSTAYLKCENCGKLNPVNEALPGGEYTCVFCGQLFKAPSEKTFTIVDAKRHGGEKKPKLKTSKPKNKNLRKPMI